VGDKGYQCGHSCGLRVVGGKDAIESSPWNDWGSLDIMHYVWAYVTAPAARHASPPRRSSCTTRSAIPQHERELATPSSLRSRGWSPRKLSVAVTSTSIYFTHRPPTLACGHSRYFPVVCRRVTFLIVIRHTHRYVRRVRVRVHYIDTRVYPVIMR